MKTKKVEYAWKCTKAGNISSDYGVCVTSDLALLYGIKGGVLAQPRLVTLCGSFTFSPFVHLYGSFRFRPHLKKIRNVGSD